MQSLSNIIRVIKSRKMRRAVPKRGIDEKFVRKFGWKTSREGSALRYLGVADRRLEDNFEVNL